MPSPHYNRFQQQIFQSFVGRTEEITTLLTVLDEDGPAVIFVHGIGGIGKPTRLDVFAMEAQVREAVVVRLDCRAVKPSEDGFLCELSTSIGGDDRDLAETVARLGNLDSRVVLALDTYEVYRRQNTWLRQMFIPLLSDNVRVLLFGREAPVSTWFNVVDAMVHSLRKKLGNQASIIETVTALSVQTTGDLWFATLDEMPVKQLIEHTLEKTS